MKKSVVIIVSLLLLLSALPGAYAVGGDAVGYIYSTDIVAYIGAVPIDSYNIGGKTVIIAEDLGAGGYAHNYEYDDEARLLNIRSNFYEPWGEYAEIPRGKTGKVVGTVYETDIRVLYNNIPVTGYNIGGRTALCIEELGELAGSSHEAYGYSKYLARYEWNEAERTIRLHTFTTNREEIMGLNLSRASYEFSDNVLSVIPDETVVHSGITSSLEFSEAFGEAKYSMAPLYLKAGEEKTAIGTVVTVQGISLFSDPPQEVYENTYMHIDDPKRVLELAKAMRPPAKGYEEALTELTTAYEEVKRLALSDYTVLHLKDEQGTDLIYALKKTGGCLLIDRYGDDYSENRIVDILPGDEPHQSITTLYPFADPHGKAVTMHGIHDLDALCFD